MSLRDKRDRGALTTLALLVFGAIIASFFGFIEQIQQQLPYQENATIQSSEEYNAWQDTWANWSIAVFSAVAATASVGALIYLRGTLNATRGIGQAQVRAYITLAGKHVDSFDKDVCAKIRYSITNIGSSPAKQVRHLGVVELRAIGSDSLFPSAHFSRVSEKPGISLSSDSHVESTAWATGQFTEKQLEDFRAGRALLYLFIRAEYEDVFQLPHVEQVAFFVRAVPDVLQKLSNGYEPDDLSLKFVYVPEFTVST